MCIMHLCGRGHKKNVVSTKKETKAESTCEHRSDKTTGTHNQARRGFF